MAVRWRDREERFRNGVSQKRGSWHTMLGKVGQKMQMDEVTAGGTSGVFWITNMPP